MGYHSEFLKECDDVGPGQGRSVKDSYTYPEGDTYEGEWSKEGKKHGLGVLKFADGCTYEGRFAHGLFHGNGTLTFTDGTTYQGEFRDGLFNGFGVYKRCDDTMFEGSFKNGRVDGPGLITFSNGTNGDPRQEGYFEGTKLSRREPVPDAIKKARLCAERAQNTINKKKKDLIH